MSVHDPDTQGLTGQLKRTIHEMCAAEFPPSLEQKIIASLPTALPRKPFRAALWATSAIAAALLVSFLIWNTFLNTSHKAEPQPIAAGKDNVVNTPITPPSVRSVAPVPTEPLPLAAGRAGNPRSRGGRTPTTPPPGPTPSTTYMAIASDSPLLATVSRYSGSIQLWDYSTSQIAPARAFDAAINGPVTLSPDGQSILIPDGRLLDTRTGDSKALLTLDGRPRGASFSHDSSTLALFIAHPNPPTTTIRILDFPAATLRSEIPNQSGGIVTCALSSDGKQAAITGTDFTVRRFDTATGKELLTYKPSFTTNVRALAISPDGQFLAAASSRNDSYLWDLVTGKLLFTLQARQSNPNLQTVGALSLLFSPDSKLLAATGAQEAFLWSTTTGQPTILLPANTGGIGNATQLRFSPDNKKLFILACPQTPPSTLPTIPPPTPPTPTLRTWDLEKNIEIK